MSAPYIIPFNFQPVSTGASTSTYTVPSGKYARVVISLSSEIGVQTTANPSGAPVVGESFFTDGSNSISKEFWLKATDSVSLSTTSGSGTITSGTNAQVQKSSCVASATINGTSVLVSRSTASALMQTAAAYIASFVGNPSASVYYEEYNVIS